MSCNKQSRSLILSLIISLTLLLFWSSAAAVTIRASSATIYTGERVRFTVTSAYNPGLVGPNCILMVNFGDNTSSALPVCNSLSCTASTSHSYNQAGIYRATAQPQSSCATLTPPHSASVTITVKDRIQQITLPDGIVGIDYSYQLGSASNRYNLVMGQTDPGLKIIGNQLQGVPQKAAAYRFQIRETEATGLISFTWYNLKISRSRLVITVTPTRIQYDASHAQPFTLSYSSRSTAPLNDTLNSTAGIFRAGTTALGTLARPLSAVMNRGAANFSESLTIPQAVIYKARQQGINQINFHRSFSSTFMDSASTSTEITLKFAPDEVTLPGGIVGVDYTYKLGAPTNHYQLVKGTLPPGLKLESHMLRGIPIRAGNSRFQIKKSQANRNLDIFTWYNLSVSKSTLQVNITPRQITIDRNRPETFNLTYNLSNPERINDTIVSAVGIFFAAGTEIGRIDLPLSTAMTSGRAQLKETVTVPLAILKTAERQGIDKLNYQRTFTARYMNAITTGTTALTMDTGFTFTKIKILFSDKSSKKFVKRNAGDIGAQVELRYEGAGILKGYWQADNRILAQVTQSLTFANARTITLKLPQSPPLPTHTPGSHRLRFVITEPPMEIAFPQIIYIVRGEELNNLHPIQLIKPEKKESLAAANLAFSWTPRADIAVYQLEIFLDDTNDKINNDTNRENSPKLFSAYTKVSTYNVPEIVRHNKFSSPGSYLWQITGFDDNNQPLARSSKRSFTLVQKTNLNYYIPGRLLLAEVLTRTTSAGIIVLAPAGNDLEQQNPAFPAALKEVVSVAGQNEDEESVPNRFLCNSTHDQMTTRHQIATRSHREECICRHD